MNLLSLLLLACVSILNVVAFPHPPHTRVARGAAAGSAALGNVTVSFSAPCHHCLPAFREQLDFQLEIPVSEFECTALPVLNNVQLSENSDARRGDVVFRTQVPDHPQQQELHGHWQVTCLDGKATLLSVHVQSESVVAGFAISFKQVAEVQIIRLEGVAVEDVDNIPSPSSWLVPDSKSAEDYTVHPTSSVSNVPTSLCYEYQELDVLKKQVNHLRRQIARKEEKIRTMLKSDFKSCTNFKCVVQVAVQKASGFWRFVKAHFWNKTGDSSPTCSLPEAAETPFESANGADSKNDSPLPPSMPSSGHEKTDDVPPKIPETAGKHEEETPFWHHDRPSGSRFSLSSPFSPPPPPPPPPHGPHYDSQEIPLKGSPPHDHPHRYGPPPHHRPSIPHPAPRHPHFRLIIATCALVSVAIILTGLLVLLRLYLSNPRVQAERATRREECRTRRAYKRAACKHRFRQLFSRFRRSQPDLGGDYEEKRAIVRHRTRRGSSSSESNGIMRTDIASLRRAHELVGELMRVEEGRSRTQNESFDRNNVHGDQDARGHAESSNRSVSSVTTLPPYVPPPPRYSQELSRDMEVVDGFRYTPSSSQATACSSASSFIFDDDVTDSSVADCRIRMSLDTEGGPRSQKSLELAGDRMRRHFE